MPWKTTLSRDNEPIVREPRAFRPLGSFAGFRASQLKRILVMKHRNDSPFLRSELNNRNWRWFFCALGKGTIRRKNSKLLYAYCSKAQRTLHTKKKTHLSSCYRSSAVRNNARRPSVRVTKFYDAIHAEETLLALRAVDRLRSNAKR